MIRVALALAGTALMAGAPRATLPADVRAFVEKRARCDHLRGEDPYDAPRAAELERGMRATCTGTDAALARLKRLHRRDPAVMKALARYDPRIE